MSALARTALRSALRTAPRRSRGFAQEVTQAESPAVKAYLQEESALIHHATETSDMWRKISYFVCLPAVAVCTIWVYNAESEHMAHLEHMRQENGGELPQPPEYDFLNRRNRPFPWGMNSLFFNPEVNKNMETE
ncbi:COX6A subunit VIa of cytochrome c oxidase [Agaricus bisporus var. bisporus H97]|uniref:COX6A subunit VIa of cytochrome c oxidase n=1 Tax=Agaricus bisporus var. bisporus (strain H97 / ATCC MYA-4626 / FGSC 10389) TaxID=936046 RepID=UPI00029F5332|nr:COX6A subunit VIa of cytochrome c oxidase [Agaricus bisporus var. bisporus H97]EKV51721.1 COX6A subunit VIa of cytochrome c oxidase [Agaricus bisporus var. bisporus H97]